MRIGKFPRNFWPGFLKKDSGLFVGLKDLGSCTERYKEALFLVHSSWFGGLVQVSLNTYRTLGKWEIP